LIIHGDTGQRSECSWLEKELGEEICLQADGSTEKTSPAFQDAKSSANVATARILRACCVFNPAVACVQGMRDLLHPILSVCMDESDVSNASWCFDTMLRTTNQLPAVQFVESSFKKQVSLIRRILREVAPVVGISMKPNGLDKFLLLQSDLALSYKRMFPYA
jgi:hypothetical protein